MTDGNRCRAAGLRGPRRCSGASDRLLFVFNWMLTSSGQFRLHQLDGKLLFAGVMLVGTKAASLMMLLDSRGAPHQDKAKARSAYRRSA